MRLTLFAVLMSVAAFALMGCSTFNSVEYDPLDPSQDEFCKEVTEGGEYVQGCNEPPPPPPSQPEKKKISKALKKNEVPAVKKVAELDCEIYKAPKEKGKSLGSLESGKEYEMTDVLKSPGWSKIAKNKFVKTDCFESELPETIDNSDMDESWLAKNKSKSGRSVASEKSGIKKRRAK